MSSRIPPLVVAVAGGSGSGKTTLVNVILKRVGSDRIAYLPHDAYYRDLSNLPPVQRAEVNFDHPNSLETDLLIQHIQVLKDWRSVDLPLYDFAHHARTDKTVKVDPKHVIIVEGILILSEPRLRELCDIKIFVDTDADMRFIRGYKGILRKGAGRWKMSSANIRQLSDRCTWNSSNNPSAMLT